MTVAELIEELKKMPQDIQVEVMVEDSLTGPVKTVELQEYNKHLPFVLLDGE